MYIHEGEEGKLLTEKEGDKCTFVTSNKKKQCRIACCTQYGEDHTLLAGTADLFYWHYRYTADNRINNSNNEHKCQ